MMQKRYRMLAHTSDAYIEAMGRSIEEAFEEAAKGMFSVILDLRKVKKREDKNIEISNAEDIQSLLYSWLEQLLVMFETEKFVPRESKVKIHEKEGVYTINALLRGERVSASSHLFKREVKAITYHAMEILKEQDSYKVRFILDL